MEIVTDKFQDEFDKIKEVLTIDGVRLQFEDNSWVLIRPSGTEPYIRITAEAMTQQKLDEIIDIATKFLEKQL